MVCPPPGPGVVRPAPTCGPHPRWDRCGPGAQGVLEHERPGRGRAVLWPRTPGTLGYRPRNSQRQTLGLLAADPRDSGLRTPEPPAVNPKTLGRRPRNSQWRTLGLPAADPRDSRPRTPGTLGCGPRNPQQRTPGLPAADPRDSGPWTPGPWAVDPRTPSGRPQDSWPRTPGTLGRGPPGL